MRRFAISLIVMAAMILPSIAMAQDVAQHLQDVSVTIKSKNQYNSGGSEGSGVLITREVKIKDGGKETVKVNLVWTAAHVITNLRTTRTIIDSKGQKTTIVEFRDAQIVKELVEDGRKVGELKMDAKVILYSDSEDGHDLALLLVRKKGFVGSSATFHLGSKKAPVGIGTRLFHVGSLLGQSGANSMTNGIMSQVGRVLQLGTGDGTIFDQTTCAAFPGSSGGGVFLAGTKKEEVRYVGMLVRGAGETFNLIVPVRRMYEWAEARNVLWALDPAVVAPCLDDIKSIEPEAQVADHASISHPKSKEQKFKFMIREMKQPEIDERE
jgi:hypothetical protein